MQPSPILLTEFYFLISQLLQFSFLVLLSLELWNSDVVHGYTRHCLSIPKSVQASSTLQVTRSLNKCLSMTYVCHISVLRRKTVSGLQKWRVHWARKAEQQLIGIQCYVIPHSGYECRAGATRWSGTQLWVGYWGVEVRGWVLNWVLKDKRKFTRETKGRGIPTRGRRTHKSKQARRGYEVKCSENCYRTGDQGMWE